ncbi:MAG: hypothetical protein IJ097_02550 [Bacilli bacterium]|nr:hypothetical protein [Bacilli bacterium]
MKFNKTKNEHNAYDVKLIEGEKELLITLDNNRDLYMSITNNKDLDKKYNDYRSIYIRKEDDDIYDSFDLLYKCLMYTTPKDNKLINEKENSIIWVSDDGIEEEQDYIVITRYKDYYRLLFVRNNMYDNHKQNKNIVIKFATSSSRYNECSSYFVDMYHTLIQKENPKIYKK